MEDTYHSISGQAEGLYKEKGSKFISLAFHVENEEDIKDIIRQIRKNHHAARHHCYAWRLGAEGTSFRTYDDGEPSSTGGKPILRAIMAAGLTNILVVVVRYFGGILLGVSGLINAYHMAASDAIRNANITTQKIEIQFRLSFGYNLLNEVMQLIKSGDMHILNMSMDESCEIIVAAARSEAEKMDSMFRELYGVRATKIE